jgi:hypothetical protein
VIQTRFALIALIVAATSFAACSKSAQPQGGAAVASAPAAAPPAAEAAHAAAGGAAANTVTGTVAETMDSGTYTYVRLQTDAGEIWAASNQFPVKVGERVTVPLEMPMENFHSKSLNRDFPLIYFASRIVREGEAIPGAAPTGEAAVGMQMPPAHPPAQEVAAVTELIPQPDGGTSIAKICDSRKALAGQTVTVRGKVVKVNSGIMGRNWLHLQDGTGVAADRTNDLTLTSEDEARVGDVITATGTIGIDRNFGAGYAYPVILEKAKLVAK